MVVIRHFQSELRHLWAASSPETGIHAVLQAEPLHAEGHPTSSQAAAPWGIASVAGGG